MKKTIFLSSISALTLALSACETLPTIGDLTPAAKATSTIKQIEFEKYTLANGLDVVLHVDRSDPVVAIDLTAHVGSSREIQNRTGFAHLFEHLLFLDSENLGYGGLDEMNTRIGGEGTNGYTTTDVTKYFQAVPSDALEKIIWAEADKLGWFINTVTQPVLDNEKQVVKNEKRQRVDNQPYGHNWGLIGKTLYPADHPYSWPVIGSLADLDAATLKDVKDFYNQWYVPNNVTVTLTGDFDVAQAKLWVEKYFGEIPRGPDVEPLLPRAASLEKTVNLHYEDNFAKVPQLTLTWPSVKQFDKDAYALDILSTYLSEGKRAPLNEVIIDEDKISTTIAAFTNSSELAGEFYVLVRANADGDLDDVKTSINKAFTRFEENGISQADLDRIKAGLEVDFYTNIQSVLGKAIQLGEYNTLAGDPGFIQQDVKNIQAVTTEDVMRVYQKYIKDRPYVSTSFVPKGQIELALEGSIPADIAEEKIVQGAETETDFDPTARTFEPTPSAFDRTIEPEFGAAFTMPSPDVYTGYIGETEKNIALFGIENSETPLVNFSLKIDAGDLRANIDKPAIPTLTAALMNKGTANKTTAELEDAIKGLGSNISIFSNASGTFVTGSSLARNFDKTMALVEEMVMEPRWDEDEFETLLRDAANTIDQQAANPNAIANRELAEAMYPADNIYSVSGYGPKDKLLSITLDDLKAFYSENFTPVGAQFRYAGDVTPTQVKANLADLASRWKGDANPALNIPQAVLPEKSKVYFYDIPGAKQSVFRISRPSLSAVDPDFFKAQAMNYLLGDIYTSKLNTELRVNKGYTYGIGSRFNGDKDRGTFGIFTSVRTNVTLESAQLIKDILSNYGPDFGEEDLATMKSALLKGQALSNETLSAKLGLVGQISAYGYPTDYQARNAKEVAAMSLEDFKALAAQYLRPNEMYYVIVGDAESQADRMKALGFGDPILLDD